MAQLTISGLHKKFGAVEVLHDVDVDIADGEFVALVGPSGCGKSTLLRSIAGLEDISGGDIRIGERSVGNIAPKHRNVAMVFQNYALYPHMTVRENLGFSLKLGKVTPDEISRRVAEAANILGLDTLLDRKPRQLSGGQRQRVAMGRAIVRNPDVFLFDEPLSNLDAKLRVQMRTEIRGLHQRLGTTTVYVTHDQIEAMTMADKIVVLRDGRVEQVGAPLDLYDRPRNAFVAGFIGSPSMNMLTGVIRDGVFVADSGDQLPVPQRFASLQDKPVIYGVRPDDLHVNDAGKEVVAEIVEQNGAESFCVLQDGGITYNLLSKTRLEIRPGNRIKVKIDNEKVHIFDVDTGIVLEI